MHICNFYCHHPYHATNMLISQPFTPKDMSTLLQWMRKDGQQVLEIERVIPVTEAVDLQAWWHQHPDGKDVVLPSNALHGIVVVARYPEEILDAVS